MLLWICIAFVAGSGFIQFLSVLPSLKFSLILCVASGFFFRRMPWLCAALLGFIWAHYSALSLLQHGLDPSLEGETVVVEGTIASIPKQHSYKTDFIFKIDTRLDVAQQRIDWPLTTKLSWYTDTPPDLQVGARWQFAVRLKRPYGFMNPGGFDYEKGLFREGIRATGYVYDRTPYQLIENPSHLTFSQWRAKLAHHLDITLQDSPVKGLMKALTVGLRDDITPEDWQILQATGTSHLMAISGLHIGIVAAGVFGLIQFLWRRCPAWALRIPAPVAAAVVTLAGALGYSALAGFALPTQRAMVMISVIMLGLIARRPFAPWHSLALSAALVVIIDPFATWSMGFWLSFGAVAVIFLSLAGRLYLKGIWYRYGRIQWVIFLGLTPLTLGFFQQISWLSPVINILAVPFVGLLVVPLGLVGILLSVLSVEVSQGLLSLSAGLLEGLWYGLTLISQWDWILWTRPHLSYQYGVAAAFGAVLLLMPHGFPGRYLSVIGFLPLFVNMPNTPKDDEMWFTLLDVGQGLAAVIQTTDHVLVFDTGPRFSPSFDAGHAVLVPFLKAQGIKMIDQVVISHAHADHDGGLQALQQAFTIAHVFSGDPLTDPEFKVSPCHDRVAWEWDNIEFRFLHPSIDHGYQYNNASCVLQVSMGKIRLLLTGDIENSIEQQLVAKLGNTLQSNIIIAPHHGSATSSTSAFVANVNPDEVLFATGYRNRFRFPHQAVVARYQHRGARDINTVDCGAVQYIIRQNRPLDEPECYRDTKRQFWHTLN